MCIVRNGKEGHNKCHKIDRKIEVDPIKIRPTVVKALTNF